MPRAKPTFEARKSISTLVPACELADVQMSLKGSLNIDQRAKRLRGINQENVMLFKKLVDAPTSVSVNKLYESGRT